MKKILLILLLLPLFCFSQVDSTMHDFPYRDGKIIYEKVVEVKGLSKEFIYGFSKKWVMNKFSNQLARPIKTEDLINGQIVARVSSPPIYLASESTLSQQIFLDFWIQIDTKEEKCRIKFFDFNSLRPSSILTKGNVPLEEYDKSNQSKRNENKTGNWDKFTLKINLYLGGLFEDFKTNLVADSKDSF
jgi:hypothetical protein